MSIDLLTVRGSMTGQIIMSIAYGIDALPENDPYAEGAEKIMNAFAVGSTQEAALLDATPWCICRRVI